MPDPVDEFLEHNGVKGMHWGSRKSKVEDTRTPAQKRKAKQDKIAKIKRNIGDVTAVASLAAFGAYTVHHAIVSHKWDKLISEADKASQSRGRNYAMKMIGDMGKSLPYSKIANGAYKVTSMK